MPSFTCCPCTRLTAQSRYSNLLRCIVCRGYHRHAPEGMRLPRPYGLAYWSVRILLSLFLWCRKDFSFVLSPSCIWFVQSNYCVFSKAPVVWKILYAPFSICQKANQRYTFSFRKMRSDGLPFSSLPSALPLPAALILRLKDLTRKDCELQSTCNHAPFSAVCLRQLHQFRLAHMLLPLPISKICSHCATYTHQKLVRVIQHVDTSRYYGKKELLFYRLFWWLYLYYAAPAFGACGLIFWRTWTFIHELLPGRALLPIELRRYPAFLQDNLHLAIPVTRSVCFQEASASPPATSQHTAVTGPFSVTADRSIRFISSLVLHYITRIQGGAR